MGARRHYGRHLHTHTTSSLLLIRKCTSHCVHKGAPPAGLQQSATDNNSWLATGGMQQVACNIATTLQAPPCAASLAYLSARAHQASGVEYSISHYSTQGSPLPHSSFPTQPRTCKLIRGVRGEGHGRGDGGARGYAPRLRPAHASSPSLDASLTKPGRQPHRA